MSAEPTPAPIDIEAELAKFEAEERRRLGLDAATTPKEHWKDDVARTFTASQRAHTTILVSGLTMAHDLFVQAALRGIGYRVQHLDCPDTESLRFGKEFGNRGQCNPTYFTVGNLVKYLSGLRDAGMTSAEVVEKYVFLTAGACGPCRFGTYVTEYRKALRDSGFDGFRVLLFQQQGGLAQATGEEAGLDLSPKFFVAIVKAIMAGDVLNAIAYRIRPYEVEKGATDAAVARCKTIITSALEEGRSLFVALVRARLELSKIQVDRTIPKPKVGIIGEFWAMTTEGDGNYKLQRFLEQEGAEVDIQLVSAWILYNIWEVRHDTKERIALKRHDGGRTGLETVSAHDAWKRLMLLVLADKAVRVLFHGFANTMGLHGYVLPDMDEVADVSHRYYNNELRGGEGHMEVGKLILNVIHQKVNMTLSVKPFGCMPSSGVSDGVQSYITEKYPGGIFLAIETSGDGAVNVQSRVQMMLFKAKQAAVRESEEALAKYGLTRDDAKRVLDKLPLVSHPLFHVPHLYGSTAADMIELAGLVKRPLHALKTRLATKKAAAAATAAVTANARGAVPEPLVLDGARLSSKKSLPIIA
ncbi:2-hydroxyglutaryl-CoA dehydratase [Myxococcota bacterium]|nr:2-hydroxyglutaryl-CoA dehydratase [Myxococcota bacterium]